jgi:hypothetical protein
MDHEADCHVTRLDGVGNNADFVVEFVRRIAEVVHGEEVSARRLIFCDVKAPVLSAVSFKKETFN